MPEWGSRRHSLLEPARRPPIIADLIFDHDHSFQDSGIILDVAMSRGAPPVLGPKLQRQRKVRRMTLDALSAASGVSRSMLSQIERGQANPTFGTLWNLTQALGVKLADLTGDQSEHSSTGVEVLQAHFTPEIRTEDGGCVLRILSPPASAGTFEWYQITLEPGAILSSDAHTFGATEHLTVIEGELEVRAGEDRSILGPGATGRYAADRDHHIRNNGEVIAQAFLVVQFAG